MKKAIFGFVTLLLTVVLVAGIFFVQPIKLVSTHSYRWKLHLGKTVPIVEIADVSGGYRCYLEDDADEYIWVSANACTVTHTDEPTSLTYRIGKVPILNRRI